MPRKQKFTIFQLKRFIQNVLAFSTLLLILPSYSWAAAAFARAADVGWLSQMESQGRLFYDEAGTQKPCLQILQEHCINTIRLRVWVNPSAGWCNKADVITQAVRAKNMGFRILIDFHYSDSWADPGQQNKPAAWASHTINQLVTDVATHTNDVLTGLQAAGVTPEWVQVGNETNDGMLWEDGRASANMANFAKLIDSGYGAVKAVFPNAKVVVHISNGYDNALFRWIFDGLKNNNARWDVCGMSLYPTSANWTTYNAQCLTNMNDMVSRYGKDVFVVECGMDVAQAQACHDFLVDLINKVQSVSGGHGLGVSYWEPEAYNWMGYALVAFSANGRPTTALSAFGTGCSAQTGATSTPTRTSTRTPTRTNTPVVNTSTPTRTLTATSTRTSTLTSTPAPATSTATRTNTLTSTRTSTPMPATSTATSTMTRTASATSSRTGTSTNTPMANTSTVTSTPSRTSTATLTNTLVPATNTSTRTSTSSPTATSTSSVTPTSTSSRTATATSSRTSTPSATASPTSTDTGQPTATSTNTSLASTSTLTATPSSTATRTPTSTSSRTATGTASPSSTRTASSTATDTNQPTLTSTSTPSSVPPTNTPTVTLTFTGTQPPTASSTATSTTTKTSTLPNTMTTTASATSTASQTQTSSPTSSPTLANTSTSSPTLSASRTSTPSATATQTATSSPTLVSTVTNTRTTTLTASPTTTSTGTNTQTVTPSLTQTQTATLTATSTPLAGTIPLLSSNPANGDPINVLPQSFPGTSNVTIQIFTTDMRLVQTKDYGTISMGWVSLELTDKSGQPLAGGLYYVMVTTKTGRATAKLLILR